MPVGDGHRTVGASQVEAPSLGVAGCPDRIGKQEVDVRLVERLAVDVDLLVLQLDRLARQADDALDEVALRVLRVLEDDDVAAPDRIDRQQRVLDPCQSVGANTNLLTSR